MKLDALRADVARGMYAALPDYCPLAERSLTFQEAHGDSSLELNMYADAAIRIVLRKIAEHADTYVGKGRDIHDLIAEMDEAARGGEGVE